MYHVGCRNGGTNLEGGKHHLTKTSDLHKCRMNLPRKCVKDSLVLVILGSLGLYPILGTDALLRNGSRPVLDF